ncbi:trifunctional serine/threonine-protein kinase/ATP-binding protein/SpoIIE family protein phosphatase [Fundidesulfovibrio butyratiphilus]
MNELPGYTLLSRLHVGSHFQVHRALRQEDQTLVAVKFPMGHTPCKEEVYLLAREYAILRLLAGRGAVRVLGFKRLGAIPALVLEDMQGQRLAELARQQVLSVQRFLDLAASTAQALDRVHKAGVRHGDVTASNILVSPGDASCRFLDFGAGFRAGLPPHRQILGRPTHLAPELAGRPENRLSVATDIYALGVTFHELLTSRLPFESADPMELVHAHLTKIPDDLRLLREDLPPIVSDIVLKCLAKDPCRRYRSAAGLAWDLKRCRDALSEPETAAVFDLGEHDAPDVLEAPTALVGRQAEMLSLVQAFDRTVAGGFETVLIRGATGMGKTRLVEELRDKVRERRIFFLEGKWESRRRDAPYLALAQALSGAVRQMLGLPERELAAWRQRLTQALGDDAGLLVKALPELALVIQPNSRFALAVPLEAKNRLARQLGAMLWTLSLYSQSVVLFLDDLHWADADSLELLKALLWNANASHCLVLLTYRETILAENPAALAFVRALEAKGAGKVSHIGLAGLDRTSVAQYLGLALGESPEALAGLAKAFHEQTGGAPYFMAELLRNGDFVRERGVADKDGARPRDAQTPRPGPDRETGARMAALRIAALSALEREALQLGACLGSRFDALIPARVLGVGEDQAFSLFQASLDQAIVLLDVEGDPDGSERGQLRMRFAHDLVLEAAYASLPPPRRAQAHERLARCLLRAFPPDEHPTKIYAIANQILLCDHPEPAQAREFAAALDKAAQEAINAVAFPAAWTFASAGMRLLEPEAFAAPDGLTLALWRTGAQAALSAGLDHEFEAVSAQGLRLATRAEDKADLLALRARWHARAGRHEAAVSEMRRALTFLGDANADPVDPSPQTEELLGKIKTLLGRRRVEDLAQNALLADPRTKAELDVINAGILSVLNVDTGLYASVVARSVFLQMDKGLYPPSFPAFTRLGNLLGVWRDDDQAGLAFTRLALDLSRQQHHSESFLSSVDIVSRSVLPRTQSFHWLDGLFDEGQGLAETTGVSYPTGVFLLAKARLDFFMGRPLTALANCLRRLGREAQAQGDRMSLLDGVAMYFGFKGLTEDAAATAPGPAPLTEGRVLRELTAHRQHVSLTDYKTCKMASSYHLRRYRAVLALHRLAKANKLTDTASLAMVPQHFYAAMSLLALCNERNMDLGPGRLAFLEETLDLLRDLEARCPINFSSWSRLLQAEHSRAVKAPVNETVALFERALRASRRNGFVQNEALGRELLGRFFLSQGRAALAKPMLGQAIAGYRAWGAEKVASRLQHEFGPLLRKSRDDIFPAGLETAPISQETLDLLTVLKSARIISAETNPSRLIPLLMGILAESAGAERGAFFRMERGELQLVAHSRPKDPRRFELVQPGREPKWDSVYTALRFVARTGESLVLSDASTDSIFGGEAKRQAVWTRSLLCLPIPGFSGPVGLVYLENNQMPGAFTAARLGVVRTLAAQASVALENAALFDSLRVAEKKYRGIVDSAPLGIFQTNRDGVLTDVNPALAVMLGFVSARHLLATERRVLDFCLDNRDLRRLLKRQPGERDARGLEMPLSRNDGSILWARLHIQRERDASGRSLRFMGMVEDITALKQSAEQLQRLNRDQLRIQEQERVRIAMDLHDNVAQNLLAIKLGLGQAAARPELAAVDGLARTLAKLAAGLTDSLAAVRDLSHALQPPDLDGLGLAGALESFCRDCSRKSDTEVDFLAAGLEALALDRQAQAHCYRLVQEGVSNALRHSGADRITVRLTVSHPKLIIRIEDNGCGFDVAVKSAAALREKRMGLRGMRERAHILGGGLRIQSRPGEGTRILAEVANRREQDRD